MNIEINICRIVKIDITYNSVDELSQIERFYFSVLSKTFLDKAGAIVTIAPQRKYSLGYEFSPYYELSTGNVEYLINEINTFSSSMLMEIAESEEFRRGLLILIVERENLSHCLEEIVRLIHNKIGFENIEYEVVRCENDGNSLYIYNAELSKEELLTLREMCDN